MKHMSGSYSHLPKASAPDLQPRKAPQQSRSTATVEAIYDAAVQVLLTKGIAGCTTVHVAKRAGVSAGTLYQYFPNKQALLCAVLDRHMVRTVVAVEEACARNHFQPLDVMIDALVNRFIDVKLVDRGTSVALYKIAADIGASLIVERVRVRYETAITAMLQTAKLSRSTDIPFVVHMIYCTMAGTLRGHLEGNASSRTTKKLRQHLALLITAYCKAA